MKSTKSNKPAKIFKDITKILGGGKKGKHRNRPLFGGSATDLNGKALSHMGKKDKIVMAIFLGLIGLVIVSLIVFAVVRRKQRQREAARKARAIEGLTRGNLDIESSAASDSDLQQNGVTDGSVNPYQEKVTYVTGEDLIPPTGNWGQSDHTLSADAAAVKAGSVAESSAGSSLQTQIPIATPEVLPETLPEFTPSSPMPAVLPSVLPEVAPSSPFVDAAENIGLADGGPDASTQKS
ncbi:hypothetical protein TWF281_010426 [Arthrobotrys megalospora]